MNNELAYDENYTVEYYTMHDFIIEYPDEYRTMVRTADEDNSNED